ncbi:MAG: 16S rRNA (guanine(527)-N(7))-methyltransferase RsmG [Micavibrio sp.]
MQPDPFVNVSHETLSRLRQYEALLTKWQKAINLVGPATIPESWDRHFADSAQLAALVPADAKILYDLGSGAGFPGLVLAMLRLDLAVTLIEADQKKCAFLATVSHETKTPVKILTQRIEQATESLPAPDIVTARALASLPDLLRYIKPWVKMRTGSPLVGIFPKGAQAQAETEAARINAQFDQQEIPSLTDRAARILVLSNIRYLDEKD